MHYIIGLILAIIFQPAHVNERTEYPQPDDNKTIENNWAIHQLHTTANFSNKNRIFSWFIGGLDLQVEHHLFPNICHVHYQEISSIIKSTAIEFGITYKSFQTIFEALRSHFRMLKKLSIEPK
jgi:linoleoyl-CoA desaturase